MLVGVLAALVMTRSSNRGHLLNRYGLVLSTVYLSWTVVAKFVVDRNIDMGLDIADRNVILARGGLVFNGGSGALRASPELFIVM